MGILYCLNYSEYIMYILYSMLRLQTSSEFENRIKWKLEIFRRRNKSGLKPTQPDYSVQKCDFWVSTTTRYLMDYAPIVNINNTYILCTLNLCLCIIYISLYAHAYPNPRIQDQEVLKNYHLVIEHKPKLIYATPNPTFRRAIIAYILQLYRLYYGVRYYIIGGINSCNIMRCTRIDFARGDDTVGTYLYMDYNIRVE